MLKQLNDRPKSQLKLTKYRSLDYTDQIVEERLLSKGKEYKHNKLINQYHHNKQTPVVGPNRVLNNDSLYL
jgi:hypothetical protein